jgi:hypothetical protein
MAILHGERYAHAIALQELVCSRLLAGIAPVVDSSRLWLVGLK